ncbi:MAG: HAD family hydrolase [Candidatus Thorarchaeota archaeon]
MAPPDFPFHKNKSLIAVFDCEDMHHKEFKDFLAISFDMGGTLIEPFVMPIFEVHKKFIHQVCGDDYSFSDDEIAKAIDFADKDAWKGVQKQDMHYFFSDEDWTERNRITLKTLGVTEQVNERAKHMQTLWTVILTANPHKLKPDTKDTLEQLKARGYRLAVSTNWSDPHETLRSFRINDMFQSIQFSIVPGYCKPSPYMLIQNAQEMGVNPLNCAYVGDDIKRDVPAAKRAGMHPILVVNEGYDVPHIDESITVIRELKELLVLFE